MAAATPDSGRVGLAIDGPLARVTFERPAARNAMTLAMYGELVEVCDAIDAAPEVRAAVFRGAGGAFVAGTDIAEFAAFRSGEDGLAYEARVGAVISRLERLRVPTLAAIDGPAMGGGLVLAAACDLRIVTTRSRLGVPIARTLGNCLAAANLARLVRALGEGRVRAMLLLSGTLDGPEAKAAGFALDCVEPEALDRRADEVLARLAAAAPLTLAATRTALRRLADAAPAVADDDLVRAVYGSADFREGMDAFLGKRSPAFTGS